MLKGLKVPFLNIKRGVFRFEGEMEVHGERVLEFTHSSLSRDRLYYISLNVDTLEVDCPCEFFRCKVLGWEYFLKYGTQAELEGFDAGVPIRSISAQITRNAAGLCVHSRKVQNWIRRRGLELAIEAARTPEEAQELNKYLNGNICGILSRGYGQEVE